MIIFYQYNILSIFLILLRNIKKLKYRIIDKHNKGTSINKLTNKLTNKLMKKTLKVLGHIAGLSAITFSTCGIINNMTLNNFFDKDELKHAETMIPDFIYLNRDNIDLAHDEIFVDGTDYFGYHRIDYLKEHFDEKFHAEIEKIVRFQRFIFQMRRSGLDIKLAETSSNEIIDQDENITLMQLQSDVGKLLELHHSPEMHHFVYGGVHELPYLQTKVFYNFVVEKVYRARKRINYWTNNGVNAWIFS